MGSRKQYCFGVVWLTLLINLIVQWVRRDLMAMHLYSQTQNPGLITPTTPQISVDDCNTPIAALGLDPSHFLLSSSSVLLINLSLILW